MAKKRMRYQWWQEVPRNVTRREYGRLQLLNFAATGLGALAALMAFAGISGLTLRTSQQLAEVDAMTIEEAVAYDGDRIELIQLQGYLVTDNPLVMPDDAEQNVIRGRVKLVARAGSESDTPESDPVHRETLFEWEQTAASVFLSDGDRQIPLAFDLASLPMEDDTGGFSPRTVRDGESSRNSRPEAVEYADKIYPLSSEKWGEIYSVFTDFERETLPHGQSAVVVASLETSPNGNQLIDPLGNRLQVLMGTEDEIRQQGEQTRTIFLLLPIPLAIASFMLWRSARQLRQEFVGRSNHPE